MDDDRIEEYRHPWESDEHWKLRKDFIQRYKDQFSEYTLVAFSQLYSDTELHGKRFPVPVILPKNQECEETADDHEGGTPELLVEEHQIATTNSRNDSGASLKQPSCEDLETDLQECMVEESDTIPLEVSSDEEMLQVYSFPENFGDEPRQNSLQVLAEKSDYVSLGSTSDETALHFDMLCENLKDEREQNSSQAVMQKSDEISLESPSSQEMIQFDTLFKSLKDGLGMKSSESVMQEPYAVSVENSSSQKVLESGTLPKRFKENIIDLFLFVRKSHFEKLNALQILEKLSKKFDVRVEYHSEVFRTSKSVHECSLEIDGVLISKGKGSTKKNARRQAGKLAVDRLSNINWLLMRAKFSFNYFSKLVEILSGASKQDSLQNTIQKPDPGSSGQEVLQFHTAPKRLVGETEWDSSQAIIQKSDMSFSSPTGQNVHHLATSRGLNDEVMRDSSQSLLKKSYATSVESSSGLKVVQGTLPKSFKDNFLDVFQFIRKSHDEKVNALQILEKISKKFNVRVEYHSEVFPQAKSVHICSIEIDGVLISRGKGSTKKNARRDAGKLAIDKLMRLLTRAKLSFSYRSKISTSDYSKIFAEENFATGVADSHSSGKYSLDGNYNRSSGKFDATSSADRNISLNSHKYFMCESYSRTDGCDEIRHNSPKRIMSDSELGYPRNSYILDTLPTQVKAKYKLISQFIRKSLTQRLNPVSILNNVSQKFKVKVKYNAKMTRLLECVCFLQIDTMVISKAVALTEREARFNSAKLAVERILELSKEGNSHCVRKEYTSSNRVIATSHDATLRNSSRSESINGINAISNHDRDTSLLSLHSNPVIRENSAADLYRNTDSVINPLSYSCTMNQEVTSYENQNSDFLHLSDTLSGSTHQIANCLSIFNQPSENIWGRSDRENSSTPHMLSSSTNQNANCFSIFNHTNENIWERSDRENSSRLVRDYYCAGMMRTPCPTVTESVNARPSLLHLDTKSRDLPHAPVGIFHNSCEEQSPKVWLHEL